MNVASALRLKRAGLWLALASALILGAVLVLQYGYVDTRRFPLPDPERLARLALGLAALGLLYGAGIGVYHAGAEWGFWPGPSDCGGGTGANPGQVGDFLNQLQSTKVVDCSVAAMRVLGLSLAGWNAVVAFALASLAGTAAARP